MHSIVSGLLDVPVTKACRLKILGGCPECTTVQPLRRRLSGSVYENRKEETGEAVVERRWSGQTGRGWRWLKNVLAEAEKVAGPEAVVSG
ncbi:hypothetical protein HN51_016622 [Arachis hypogaea]